jgi:hypothetical protein
MTAPSTTVPAVPAPEAQEPAPDAPQDEARCASCPHPLAAHDPIGLRFCRATRAGDISRGCVCRVA